jgi:type I restriction enzyme R subunit
VEIVFFMRNVRSRSFFEQMKGRGVRVVSPTEFNAVTPDADGKERFVIVDAVGVTESELSDSYSLERHRTVSFERLLDLVGMGDRDPDTLSSLAGRLARLAHRLAPQDQQAIESCANGAPLGELISGLVSASDPDAVLAAAQAAIGQDDPPEEAVAAVENQLLEGAARPLAANPQLRQLLVDFHRSYMQTIDEVTQDRVIEAGFSDTQAQGTVQSFREFIQEHRDEITALQVLYQRPYRQRLTYADIKALADALEQPPRSWTAGRLWEAYRQLDKSKVRGSGQRTLADIVSVVRYAIGGADDLEPFADGVRERFRGWLAMQETASRAFTESG